MDLEKRLRQVKLRRRFEKMKRQIQDASRKNSISLEYIKNNNILVKYVTDKFGFRKGVVVASGPGQIGWSIVSKEDYEEEQKLDALQVPRLASLVSENSLEDLHDFVTDPAFKAWSENSGWVSRPKFDRNLGLTLALDSLKAMEAVAPGTGKSFDDVPMPLDDDLRYEIVSMIDRSHRYFKDKPHAMETRP